MSKRRYKRDPQQKEWRWKRYDVGMIQDFVKHLSLEIRANHLEHTAAPGHTNPEIVEEFEQWVGKYGPIGLLMVNQLQRDGATDAECERAFQLLREHKRERMQTYIDALDALQPLFDEALICASQEAVVIRPWKARRVLDEFGH